MYQRVCPVNTGALFAAQRCLVSSDFYCHYACFQDVAWATRSSQRLWPIVLGLCHGTGPSKIRSSLLVSAVNAATMPDLQSSTCKVSLLQSERAVVDRQVKLLFTSTKKGAVCSDKCLRPPESRSEAANVVWRILVSGMYRSRLQLRGG